MFKYVHIFGTGTGWWYRWLQLAEICHRWLRHTHALQAVVTLHPTDKVMGESRRENQKVWGWEGRKRGRENQSFDPGVRDVIWTPHDILVWLTLAGGETGFTVLVSGVVVSLWLLCQRYHLLFVILGQQRWPCKPHWHKVHCHYKVWCQTLPLPETWNHVI